MSKKTKIIIGSVTIVILLLISFLIGRYTTEVKTVTEVVYLPGETITNTVFIDKPIERIPADTCDIIRYCIKTGLYSELFPHIIDSVFVPTKVDTLAILYDWMKIRDYDEQLFNSETLGECNVHLTVQHNRLQDLTYTYTPKQKVITNTVQQIKKFEPFVSVGMLSQPSVIGEVGCYFKEHYGVAGIYQYDALQRKHCFGGKISYKF